MWRDLARKYARETTSYAGLSKHDSETGDGIEITIYKERTPQEERVTMKN